MTDHTPKFHRPPVIETVLGVQFAPPPALAIPHFGLFWKEIRSDYPRQEIHPPLGQVIEEYGRPAKGRLKVGMSTQPIARCWFIDEHRTELIQLQLDRFIRNWRRSGTADYPSYEQLRPKFKRDWERFLDFLEREELGRPEVNQCEVTYVNHLPLGETLDFSSAARRSVKVLASPEQEFLPEPEVITLASQYVLPDKVGRLHVSLQPAVRKDDGSSVLQLTLTARGRPTSSGVESVMEWLDLGHLWVVNGFADFTTSEMHQKWGRYR